MGREATGPVRSRDWQGAHLPCQGAAMGEPKIGTWEALDPELKRQLRVVVKVLDSVVTPETLAAALPQNWTETMYMWSGDLPPENPDKVSVLTEEVRDFIRSRPDETSGGPA